MALDVVTGQMGSGKSTLAKKLRDKYDIVEGTDLGSVVGDTWEEPKSEDKPRLRQEKSDRLLGAHRAGKRVLVEGYPPGIERIPGITEEAERLMVLDPGLLTRLWRVAGRSRERGTSMLDDVPFALSIREREQESLDRLRELIADQHTVESSEEAEKLLEAALSKKASVTKEDIHNLADDLNIPWDDDPDFMDYSESVTGKTCLDKMTSPELEKLKKSLKGRAKTAKLTHPEQRLKERTGLPLSAYTKLKKALKSKGFKTPRGVHHFKLDGKGYAVIKNVKGKPVISSFLTRHMAPPGQDLTARVGKELIEKSLRGKGRLKSGSAEEFAPGIPADRKTHDLPTTKAKWRLAVQLHKANKAGPHWDLRLVDPESGHAHSWAVPKREWPTAKKRLRLAIMQPTHTADYSTWQGTIPEGTYGAGDVELLRDEETDVDVSPDVVRFNVPGVGPMVMHRGEGNQWKLLLGRTGTQGGT